MNLNRVIFKKKRGKREVKITNKIFGLELYITKNGNQWTGVDVDIKLLKMIQNIVSECLNCLDPKIK